MSSRRFPAAVAALTALALIPAGVADASRHRGSHKRHHHAKKVHLKVYGRSASDGASSTTPSSTTPSSATPGETKDVTIASFSGGTLTLKLGDGSTVAGKVTSATEIHCDAGVLPMAQAASDNPGTDHAQQGAANSGDHPTATDHPTADDNSGADNGAGDDDHGRAACDQSSLTPGTTVREAQLLVGDGASTWKQLEIVVGQTTTPQTKS